MQHDLLGFEFDGKPGTKTMQLDRTKRDFLLLLLHKWIRTARQSRAPIPFPEFEATISKLRHAFITIPAGKGLLSPCNRILAIRPRAVSLTRNTEVQNAIRACRTLLREATESPTPCWELVLDWPDYVGMKDASKYGVGGVIVGEGKACTPTVFRVQWPRDIQQNLISVDNPQGTLTNSNLELAGLLMLWLVMEEVCIFQPADHVALFSDHSPTVHCDSNYSS